MYNFICVCAAALQSFPLHMKQRASLCPLALSTATSARQTESTWTRGTHPRMMSMVLPTVK